MNWTEIYRHAVHGDIFLIKSDPPEGVLDLADAKPCRIIPCPGSYFPCHDETCETVWDDEEEVWTDCLCEVRARAVRDALD